MSKVNKRRYCPAVERELTSAECGENRNSRYQCPASCAFNPFAPQNYAQVLEAEERLDNLSVKLLSTEPVHSRRIGELARKIDARESSEFNPFVSYELFIRRDEEGRTFMERWEKAGFPELKNDLRCFARHKATATVRLLEVQRIIDGEQVEFRDLLDPARGAFVLRDRTTAARACRYDTMLSFCYDLPFYSRMISGGVILPSWPDLAAEDVVREIVRHLGGPLEAPALQVWLAEHFRTFTKALWESNRVRQALGLARSDLRMGKAVYQLQAPYAECVSVLDAVPQVAPDDLPEEERREGFADARVWFAEEEGRRVKMAQEALGHIALGQAAWRLSAIGEGRLQDLQKRFEAALGARVKLSGTRVHDLHKKSGDELTWDKAVVPPRLLENPPRILMSSSRVPQLFQPEPGDSMDAALYREQDKRFLEGPVPALDGATAHAAARDPALLPKLKRLIKQRINSTDKMNLQTGSAYDPRWYVEELGISGLALEMPPPRAKFPEQGEEEDESDLEGPGGFDRLAAKEGPEPGRPRAPRLPANMPLAEAEKRFALFKQRFASAEEADKELVAAGCTLLDDAYELLPVEISEVTRAGVYVAIMHVWFAMVPEGTYVPEIPTEKLSDAFQRKLNEVLATQNADDIMRVITSKYQPAISELAIDFLGRVFESPNVASKRERKKSFEQLPMLMAVVSTLIDELHLALGEG